MSTPVSEDTKALDLKALRERVQRLQAELETAERALRDAQLAAAPFKVGDVVLARSYGRFKEYQEAIIRRVSPHSYGTDYRASFRRKDGQWGLQERYVYDVKAAKPSASSSSLAVSE